MTKIWQPKEKDGVYYLEVRDIIITLTDEDFRTLMRHGMSTVTGQEMLANYITRLSMK